MTGRRGPTVQTTAQTAFARFDSSTCPSPPSYLLLSLLLIANLSLAGR